MSPHPDDVPLPFSRLDLAAMKRREFVTKNSQWEEFDFLLLFNVTITHTIRLPAPFLFDHDIRHGWSLSEIELDEYLAQQQYMAPVVDAAAHEDEYQAPPLHAPEGYLAPHGEGSSSQHPGRMSFSTRDARYDPWAHHYGSGAGGNSCGSH